jgi:transcriptional regulator of acetoin/glycerol metabolism
MPPGDDRVTSAVVRARDGFLQGQERVGGVREAIATSWRRSRLSGADPSVTSLPYTEDLDLESRLYAAAYPVLARVADRLRDTGAGVLLADRDARIVARWTAEPDLRHAMDRSDSAPGFSLHEEICGTNGLGSVLEERRALYVLGAEHFAERFLRYACYGAPVAHPVTGRLEGVVTLVCQADDASPLMLPFVLETAESIRDRLRSIASTGDRMLAEAFTEAGGNTRRAVAALNEHTIITNSAASRLLDGADHGLLWAHAAEVIERRRPESAVLRLRSGRTVHVALQPLAEDAPTLGAVVRIAPCPPHAGDGDGTPQAGVAHRRPASPASPASQLLSLLGGTAPAWVDVVRRAARTLPGSEPLLLVGEPGVGKLHLATALHQVAGAGDLRVLDAALAPLDGLRVWLGGVRDALLGDGTVVLDNLAALDGQASLALAALLDAHVEPTSRVRVIGVQTVDAGRSPPREPHLDRLAVHRLDLPPLRRRSQDIPELLERLLAAHRRPGLRFHNDAIEALLRASWPGNVRQLEHVLRAVAATHPCGDVTVDDLPPEVLESSSALTWMEDLNRQAIVQALRQADGNKKAAADQLGISRSTLYRKMRAFRIDPG